MIDYSLHTYGAYTNVNKLCDHRRQHASQCRLKRTKNSLVEKILLQRLADNSKSKGALHWPALVELGEFAWQ